MTFYTAFEPFYYSVISKFETFICRLEVFLFARTNKVCFHIFGVKKICWAPCVVCTRIARIENQYLCCFRHQIIVSAESKPPNNLISNIRACFRIIRNKSKSGERTQRRYRPDNQIAIVIHLFVCFRFSVVPFKAVQRDELKWIYICNNKTLRITTRSHNMIIHLLFSVLRTTNNGYVFESCEMILVFSSFFRCYSFSLQTKSHRHTSAGIKYRIFTYWHALNINMGDSMCNGPGSWRLNPSSSR